MSFFLVVFKAEAHGDLSIHNPTWSEEEVAKLFHETIERSSHVYVKHQWYCGREDDDVAVDLAISTCTIFFYVASYSTTTSMFLLILTKTLSFGPCHKSHNLSMPSLMPNSWKILSLRSTSSTTPSFNPFLSQIKKTSPSRIEFRIQRTLTHTVMLNFLKKFRN